MENIKAKFDFDDILIVPSVNTHVTSRYKDIKLPKKLPLFTAPMDTVVNLDNFNTFSIYQVLPQLIDLWGLNVKTDIEAKKNFVQQSAK